METYWVGHVASICSSLKLAVVNRQATQSFQLCRLNWIPEQESPNENDPSIFPRLMLRQISNTGGLANIYTAMSLTGRGFFQRNSIITSRLYINPWATLTHIYKQNLRKTYFKHLLSRWFPDLQQKVSFPFASHVLQLFCPLLVVQRQSNKSYEIKIDEVGKVYQILFVFNKN